MKASTSKFPDRFQPLAKFLRALRRRWPGRSDECANCQAVLGWLRGQNLPATAAELRLPPHLAHMSVTQTVCGWRAGDGRHCALLKKTIGWKENFEGVFCSDAPLRPSEIVGEHTARAYISMAEERPFQELYIRRKFSDRCFAVYFDLN